MIQPLMWEMYTNLFRAWLQEFHVFTNEVKSSNTVWHMNYKPYPIPTTYSNLTCGWTLHR